MSSDLFNTKRILTSEVGKQYHFYSLVELAKAFPQHHINRLPISLRMVLESVLRNCDHHSIHSHHISQLAAWQPNAVRTTEVPLVVSRILLQDLTGIPLLCDLAAMRDAAVQSGLDPAIIEPTVPVHLVIDHSVRVDNYATDTAAEQNIQQEFVRNIERYQFLKWGMKAFKTFQIIPPGEGIVHQINLEHLFTGVCHKDGLIFPDTLVGTDSHTTMINALGVVAWGVGGIEAEAAMLGQPVYFLMPDVVGVQLIGSLQAGILATDVVLSITEILRKHNVVGKFVEFYGTGAEALTLPDRATIANMAPEYGATMGFFPIDHETIRYMHNTGRSQQDCQLFLQYFLAQQLFGMPQAGDIDYSEYITIDLSKITTSIAGPKRPQDRIDINHVKDTFANLLYANTADGGFNVARQTITHITNHPSTETAVSNITNKTELQHGDVLIAAITSCTNTSNPIAILTAALLAKNAISRGLMVDKRVKTSFAPGSKVVAAYLLEANLQQYLDQLGFNIVGYGCTTCIGNSGDLATDILTDIKTRDLVCCAVLSGNRNFEARIHPYIKANFLMSPPLVIAYALAGTININFDIEPLGQDSTGNNVFLHDIWPDNVQDVLQIANNPAIFRKVYTSKAQPLWDNIVAHTGIVYHWPQSTYIAQPPFLTNLSQPIILNNILNAKALLILGDSITTDHISPAGSFTAESVAGQFLLAQGIAPTDFNSYGTRRGHHEVMLRGTFANVRLQNLLVNVRGGFTLCAGELLSIYEAASRYQAQHIPTVVIAGTDYGCGSSRDWAAKGTALLGVKFVIASSFERIHRANLVGMGVLPLEFIAGENAATLAITADDELSVIGINDNLQPKQILQLVINNTSNSQEKSRTVDVLCRIDTTIELEYYKHGGILPYTLRKLIAKHSIVHN